MQPPGGPEAEDPPTPPLSALHQLPGVEAGAPSCGDPTARLLWGAQRAGPCASVCKALAPLGAHGSEH